LDDDDLASGCVVLFVEDGEAADDVMRGADAEGAVVPTPETEPFEDEDGGEQQSFQSILETMSRVCGDER